MRDGWMRRWRAAALKRRRSMGSELNVTTLVEEERHDGTA